MPEHTSCNTLLSGPFPQHEGSFVWVFDCDGRPVTNAVIAYSRNGITGTIKSSTGNGIYDLPPLAAGHYTMQVTTPGYDVHKQVVTVYPNIVFRKKAALGHPGSLYIPSPAGPVPVTGPTEIVSFRNKATAANNDPHRLQQIHEEMLAAMKKLVALLPHGVYYDLDAFTAAWPEEQSQRAAFQQAIMQSDVLETAALYFTGDETVNAPVINYAECKISGEANEQEIRAVFEKNNFNIISLQTRNINNSDLFWQVTVTWQLPLSLDYLRCLQTINNTLPVMDIAVAYIPQVTHSRR